MDSDPEFDELAELLQAAAEEGEISFNENATPNVTLHQNAPPKDVAATQSSTETKKPEVKLSEEAYDSSDEEDLQNFFERKYNEYGRDINTMLKRKDADRVDCIVGKEVNKSLQQSKFTTTTTKKAVTNGVSSQPKALKTEDKVTGNVYTDPIFGLRLVQPLISSTILRERMIGRQPVEIRYLQNHLLNGDLSKDWCISGVIVSKGPVQTSNAGNQYVIWRLSDLKGEIKTVSLFLFKSAFKELWKTAQGMIIAVLNPSVFSRKDNNGESSLSIDSAQRVMILGRSKDYGICKSKKKNGEPCTAIVNLGVCEFCCFHVKTEYVKMSGRSELQSATSGRGLQALKNKVLGKSEVFYGGKSFMAESAKPSPKLKAKDQQRLMSLSESFNSNPLAAAISGKVNYLALFDFQVFYFKLYLILICIGSNKPQYLSNSTRSSRLAEMVETTSAQRSKDLERLKSLNGGTSSPSSSPSVVRQSPGGTLKSQAATTPNLDLSKKPALSRDSFSFSISKGAMGKSSNDLAKAKAAAILQKKPVEKTNPNFIKYRGTEAGKKRAHSAIESNDGSAEKKRKFEEEVEKFKNDRIKQILSTQSSHADLIEIHESNVQDQYFNKLEKKEAMEEKMLNTTKMECKAVICLQCKYKSFSAAERCKTERHKLKVVDAEKRFYECEDCGNRTVTLFRIPKISCSNCEGSRWKRTGMIRDKSTLKSGDQLAIRGDEETFLGSLQAKGNINLCVSDD